VSAASQHHNWRHLLGAARNPPSDPKPAQAVPGIASLNPGYLAEARSTALSSPGRGAKFESLG